MVKATYKLCPKCKGEGRIVNPAFSVWTQCDIEADPEAFENMRNGLYDITCPTCQGLRVVTKQRLQEAQEERNDYETMLREQGIHPGSPDWF